MEPKFAKELQHIKAWLSYIKEISEQGKDAYLTNQILQKAGNSLMMKLGEAANRIARIGFPAPRGIDWAIAVANRNFIIHEYHSIDRTTS